MVVSLIRSLVDNFTTQAILRVVERYSETENSDRQTFISWLTDKDGKSYSTIKDIVPRIKQALYIIFSLICLLVISSGTYCTFYYFYIPPNYASVPIYFNYNKYLQSDCSNPESFDNETIQSSGRKFSNHNCEGDDSESLGRRLKAPPTATIDLYAGHTQWQAIIPDVEPLPKAKILDTEIPTKSHKARILQSNQQYFFDIVLTLPESGMNRDLGMFTVEVDLKSYDGLLIGTAARSSMLPYESSFLSFARQTFLMIPYLIGVISQARTVSLKCFDRFTESLEYPLRFVEIRLVTQSPSYHPNSAPSIQVTEAEVHIGKELNKIQRVMKEWFYISGMVAIMVLTFFYGSIVIFIQTLFYIIRTPSRTYRVENIKPSETIQSATEQNHHRISMERHGVYETYTYDIDDIGETDVEYECDDNSADWEQTSSIQTAEVCTSDKIKKSIDQIESRNSRAMGSNMSQDKNDLSTGIETEGNIDSNSNEIKELIDASLLCSENETPCEDRNVTHELDQIKVSTGFDNPD